MPPTALGTLYATAGDVAFLLSELGIVLREDDDADGVANTTEQSYLGRYALSYATSRINDYCLGRYTSDVLADNWTVNYWCVVIASYVMAPRRLNPINADLAKLFKDVMADLVSLRDGTYMLGDAAERISSSPAWANTRVPPWYAVRQTRVERPISEQTPPRVPFNSDRRADVIGPEV